MVLVVVSFIMSPSLTIFCCGDDIKLVTFFPFLDVEVKPFEDASFNPVEDGRKYYLLKV